MIFSYFMKGTHMYQERKPANFFKPSDIKQLLAVTNCVWDIYIPRLQCIRSLMTNPGWIDIDLPGTV